MTAQHGFDITLDEGQLEDVDLAEEDGATRELVKAESQLTILEAEGDPGGASTDNVTVARSRLRLATQRPTATWTMLRRVAPASRAARGEALSGRLCSSAFYCTSSAGRAPLKARAVLLYAR